MTDQQPAQQPEQPDQAQQLDQQPEQAQEQPEGEQPQEQPDDTDPGNREAAKYRRRLRDTETERDSLKGQLDAMRETLVDTACARGGLDRRLWDAGNVDLTELTTEDGALDLTALDGKVAELAGEFNVGRPKMRPNPGQGAQGEAPEPDTGLAAAFRQSQGR